MVENIFKKITWRFDECCKDELIFLHDKNNQKLYNKKNNDQKKITKCIIYASSASLNVYRKSNFNCT